MAHNRNGRPEHNNEQPNENGRQGERMIDIFHSPASEREKDRPAGQPDNQRKFGAQKRDVASRRFGRGLGNLFAGHPATIQERVSLAQ